MPIIPINYINNRTQNWIHESSFFVGMGIVIESTATTCMIGNDKFLYAEF